MAVLKLAAAVERHTSHPIASAITKEAETMNLELPTTSGHLTEPGHGALAEVEGRLVAVGLLEWVHCCCQRKSSNDITEKSVPAELRDLETQLNEDLATKLGWMSISQSKTTVFVGVEGVGIIGAIAVTDTLRDDARQTVVRCFSCFK